MQREKRRAGLREATVRGFCYGGVDRNDTTARPVDPVTWSVSIQSAQARLSLKRVWPEGRIKASMDGILG